MIRLGVPEDLEAVLQLDQEAVEIAHWPAHEYEAALLAADEAETLLQRRVFVAEAEKNICGYILVKFAAGLAEVENLAVAVGSRRQGVGRALLQQAVNWAREKGADRVQLEVRAGNDAARNLYTALQFVEVGRRPDYYTGPVEDAILLDLIL